MSSNVKAIARTGEDIWEGADREAERQKVKAAARAEGTDRVFRTMVPPGESKEVVILDDAPGIALYEHNLQNAEGKWHIYEECTKEEMVCPVCEKTGQDSAYVVYLSVLELDAYKGKDGEWRNSRSLMGIKSSQLPTYKKIFAAAKKRHGTLRGVVLNLERPEGSVQNSPRIGEPVEFEETGTRFDFIEDLEDECGNEEIKAKDGTLLKKRNVDIQPYDYRKLFPGAFDVEKLQEDLKARYGGEPVPGSAEEVAKEWDDEDDGEREVRVRTRRGRNKVRRRGGDTKDAGKEAKPSGSRRSRRAKAPEPEELEGEKDSGGDDEGEWD
jgi:hypothetical protein